MYIFESNNNLVHKMFLWQHVSNLRHHHAFQRTDLMYQNFIVPSGILKAYKSLGSQNAL